jgi:hypothetical protein
MTAMTESRDMARKATTKVAATTYKLQAPPIIKRLMPDLKRAKENQLLFMKQRLDEQRTRASEARQLNELLGAPLARLVQPEERAALEKQVDKFKRDESHKAEFERVIGNRRKELLERGSQAFDSSCVTMTAPYSGLYMDPGLVGGNIIISNDPAIGTIGGNYSFDTVIGLDFYLQCALGGYISSEDRYGQASITANFSVYTNMTEWALTSHVSNYLEIGIVLWDDDNPITEFVPLYDFQLFIGYHTSRLSYMNQVVGSAFNLRPNLTYLFWAWTFQHSLGAVNPIASVSNAAIGLLRSVSLCPLIGT